MSDIIEQRSDGWYKAKLGQVGASKISDVMAKGTNGKPSATRETLMATLLCERLTGVRVETFQSAEMKWGIETEPKAAAYYAFLTNTEPTLAEYVPHPTVPMTGASPDRYVGTDGLLETKCPAVKKHIQTLLGAPIDREYLLQVQWQMSCTGRLWCDFVSFQPQMPAHMSYDCRRVYRDSAKIMEIQREVITFNAELDAKLAELKAKFPFPEATAQAAE